MDEQVEEIHCHDEGLVMSKNTLFKECHVMDRHEKMNAIHLIEGYFIRKPNEVAEQTFIKAKQECIDALKQTLKNVNMITFDDFMFRKTGGKKG